MRKAIPFRITAEIAFFFSVIAVIPAFYNLHMQMVAFICAAFVVEMIAGKIKIMPVRAILAILPAVLLFTGEITPVLIVPALAVLYYVIATARYSSLELTDYKRAVLFMMIVSGFALLLGIINSFVIEREPLPALCPVFPSIFLLFAVSALRLMQMGDHAGKRMKAAAIITAVSTVAVSVSAAFLLFFVFKLCLPALSFLGKPITMLFKFLFELFPEKEIPYNEDLIIDASEEVVDIGEMGPAASEGAVSAVSEQTDLMIPKMPEMLPKIFLAVAVILVLIVAAYIVIKLAKRGEEETDDIFFEEGEENARKKKRSRKEKNAASLQPDKAVRKIYKEYLSFLSKNGLSVAKSDTSDEILSRSSFAFSNDSGAEENLRSIYLKARYSKDTVTKEDVLKAKTDLSLILKR